MRPSTRYDLLVIGGGLAGSALAYAMARENHSVLVVEKERQFRDRVRGEVLLPWGSVEAKELGIYDLLLAKCGRESPAEQLINNCEFAKPRDFLTTTPKGTCTLSFFHPEMQEVLLAAAEEAGANVIRGAAVSEAFPGAVPAITLADNGARKRIEARLIAGADGRESQIATLLGFRRERDPVELFTAGFQLAGDIPAKPALYFILHGFSGRGGVFIQNRPGNYRAYLLHHKDALPRRLSGERDFPEVMRHLRDIGLPGGWLDALTPHGIFASFDGAHRWIANPAREGFVLIGDAAAASDPVWGCGLSRTLRDVRLLRDRLLADEDWHAASQAYAADHDNFFQRLRRTERLCAALYFSMGEEGEVRRVRADGIMERHPELATDIAGLGPDAPFIDRMESTLLGAD